MGPCRVFAGARVGRERLNRTVQAEWACRHAFLSAAERAAALTPWLECYITRRRHSSLGALPPDVPAVTNLVAVSTLRPWRKFASSRDRPPRSPERSIDRIPSLRRTLHLSLGRGPRRGTGQRTHSPSPAPRNRHRGLRRDDATQASPHRPPGTTSRRIDPCTSLDEERHAIRVLAGEARMASVLGTGLEAHQSDGVPLRISEESLPLRRPCGP